MQLDCTSRQSSAEAVVVCFPCVQQTWFVLSVSKKREQHGRRPGMLSAGHPDHPVKVTIVEVGYTSETIYNMKRFNVLYRELALR